MMEKEIITAIFVVNHFLRIKDLITVYAKLDMIFANTVINKIKKRQKLQLSY